MGISYLEPVDRMRIEEYISGDNDLHAAVQQKEKNQQVLREITELTKGISDGSIKEIFNIRGGTIVVKSNDLKQVRQDLLERKRVFENAISALDGQIQNREDDLAEKGLQVLAMLFIKITQEHGDPMLYLKPVLDNLNEDMKKKKEESATKEIKQ